MTVNNEVPSLRTVSGRILLPLVSALLIWLVSVLAAHA